MLYEKKMLILSGEGKGVVLIEKSARGVRFSLSTFDMPICGELKAGVITPHDIHVRDLPQDGSPSVFILNIPSIDNLHFAVFDNRLRLYGTNGKRMWEANVMDLLCKNDRRGAGMDDGVPVSALPPIATPPEVLPLPNGTGIPQSRLEIYGDEALAESDFYTSLDMSARMPVVDKFLDTPRVLDDLAPRIIPRSEAEPQLSETTAALDDGLAQGSQAADTAEREQEPHPEDTAIGAERNDGTERASLFEEQAQAETGGEQYLQSEIEERSQTAADTPAENRAAQTSATVPPTIEQAEADTGEDVSSETTAYAAGGSDSGRNASASESAVPDDLSEVVLRTDSAALSAAAACDEAPCMPWELEARWLKKRSGRVLKCERSSVRPVVKNESIRYLRESSFIERAKDDIEKLFGNAEKDGKLSELLPDIDWVKVDVDGHSISVGRGGNVFLCYAVLGTYEKVSPLGDEAQWLPINRSIPTGKGYWLIFQSLSDGGIISN